MLDSLWLSLFAVTLSGGQLLFKITADRMAGRSFWAALAFQPAFYAAVLLYGAATVVWIWLLTRLPLSRAYPYSAATVILVPLLASYFFGDELTIRFWVGTVLIVTGMLIVNGVV
jgi:drug/metabolite transporter (DMT)-like permease